MQSVFPVEIYERIIESLPGLMYEDVLGFECDSVVEILRSWAFVCRAWLPRCRALIFHTVVLGRYKHIPTSRFVF